MAYLGNDLQVAYPTYKNIDDISGSFNSSATSFPLLVNGVAPVPLPLNSQQCLISVGGVVQRPDDSGSEGFRLSGGNIVFASAPTTGADFFGVILAGADYVNAGGAFPTGSGSVPSITFAGDTDTGFFNYAPNEIGFGTGGVHHLTLTTAGQLAHNSGSAAAPSYSFTGDLNTGIYRPAANTVGVATNGVGRLFVDSSGNVGIGISSPLKKTEIRSAPTTADTDGLRVGDGTRYLEFAQTGATYNYMQVGGNQNLIYFAGSNLSLSTDGANAITLNTNSLERVRVTSAGNVGIGVTPSQALHIVGTADRTPVAFKGSGTGTGYLYADNTSFGVSTNSGNLGGTSAFVGVDSANHALFITSGTERARIDSSGRLLVGTSSSVGIDSKMQLKDGFFNIYHGNSGAGAGYGILFSTDGGATARVKAYMGLSETAGFGGNLVFSTTADGGSSPTERMRISQNGNILMTSSALTVASAAGSGNFDVQAQNAAGANAYFYLTCPGSNQGAVWYERATSRLYVYSQSGGVYLGSTATSWTANSDERLKDIIEPIENATEKVSSLRAVIGKYKSDEEGTRRSFLIAQDVQAVLPEAVSTDNPDQLGVAYTDVIPLLVAAIKEQQSMISALQTKVAALEAQ